MPKPVRDFLNKRGISVKFISKSTILITGDQHIHTVMIAYDLAISLKTDKEDVFVVEILPSDPVFDEDWPDSPERIYIEASERARYHGII